MTVAQDLVAITRNVLSSLGEPAMQALFWELNSQGISTNPEEFDIIKFEQVLKKIFGDGSKLFMDAIYIQLSNKHYSQGKYKEIDDGSDAINKILKILSLNISI